MLLNLFDPQFKIQKTEQEWQQILEPEVFEIARKHGTERPFSGQYCGLHKDGDYYCRVCNQYLFDSNSKFDSKTGWPSYYQAASKFSLTNKIDTTYGMEREEILCTRCNSHLGHVFDDGPPPTGLRYCMNSAVLNFVIAKKDLDLLQTILDLEEIEILKNLNIYEGLNQILNKLNKSELSLEETKKQINKILEKPKSQSQQNPKITELLAKLEE